ncbi:MAG: ABC transporter ATP-binding protein [Deltaproteobacteria bacterium]|nr:ABC transporter ATP-binding protein [Deltaproteobacteria bacterium]
MVLTPAPPILSLRGLTLEVVGRGSRRRVLEDVSLDLRRAQTLAVVGESGSGKTLTALALLQLTGAAARITNGSLRFHDEEILGASPERLCELRGRHLGMIFQAPQAALNPVMDVASQVAEPLVTHRGLTWRQARLQVRRLFDEVGLSTSYCDRHTFAHELSGGLAQRVMIAMALAGEPEVLIADEPTTALDTTVQAQILQLLTAVQRRHQMAMLFVTHDLALVAAVADDVAVMYGGRIVETGAARSVCRQPRHPYTAALWKSSARLAAGRLVPIQAPVGEPDQRGCPFAPRCPRRAARCTVEAPRLDDGVACFYPLPAPDDLRDKQ